MFAGAPHITSPHNAKVGFLRSLQTGKGRKDARAFLLEGPHVVGEALRAHLRPDLILIDPDSLHDKTVSERIAWLAEEGVEVITAPAAILAKVTEAQTPQGVVAALPLDVVAPEKLRSQRMGRMRPLVLVLDNLSDPGNVGTILRSALAADVDCVMLSMNCADPFAPKVVRAASGAHFHLPIYPNQSWDAIKKYLDGAPKMQQVLVAEAAADTSYADLDLTQRTGLIIGNEAHGPSTQARKLATKFIRIPMFNGVESLNAAIATSVILFESVRQRKTVAE